MRVTLKLVDGSTINKDADSVEFNNNQFSIQWNGEHGSLFNASDVRSLTTEPVF